MASSEMLVQALEKISPILIEKIEMSEIFKLHLVSEGVASNTEKRDLEVSTKKKSFTFAYL